MLHTATHFIALALVIMGAVAVRFGVRRFFRFLGKSSERLMYGTSLQVAPGLPISFYPSASRRFFALLICTALTVAGVYLLLVDPSSEGQFAGLLLTVSGGYILVSNIRNYIHKKPILTVNTQGIEATFVELFTAPHKAVAWRDIATIESTYRPIGNSEIPCIKLTLKNGDPLYFGGVVPRISRNQLVLWLQEYLSRYGDNVTQ